MLKYLFSFLALFSFSNFSYAFSIDPNIAADAISNVSMVGGALISVGAVMMGVSLVVGALRK